LVSNESVDLLGFWFEIEAYEKNNHRHMLDIGVCAYLRAFFFGNSEEFGQVNVDSESAFLDSLLDVIAI